MSTTDERDGSTLEGARPVRLDGDDIVVTTSAEIERTGRRDPAVGLVTVGLLVVAGLIAIVLVVRHDHPVTVRTTAPTTAKVPAVVATGPKPTTPPATSPLVTTPHATTPVTNPVAAPVSTPRVTSHTVAKPPPAPASTSPPPTTPPPPKQYGPSALTWSAPHSMTVLAESTAILAVAAHNHTDGTITLPHPLGCVPRLDHGEICPQVVQVVTHGTSAGAQYTIDAHGIAPGHYSLTIEGVLTVAVTVRPAA